MMKKNKKIIFFIIASILIIQLLQKNIVNAGSQDSTLKRNKIQGIYAIAPLSDRTHLYNLEIFSINNKIAYCIEIGKSITTEVYNSTENISEQIAITNLNNEQLNYIKAISYFGYGYIDHTDKEYYMAAQELIWEYLNNIDITWTNELDINGPKINIDAYKNIIINLAQRYITPLSITQSIQYNIGTNNIIADSQNILPFYSATSQANQQVKVQENTLEITIGTNYVGKDVITLIRKKEYNYPAAIYNFEQSQHMLSAGNLEDLTYQINVSINGSKLKIFLIDKDTNKYEASGQASLMSPEYELYDENNNLVKIFGIPYPGYLSIKNLTYGKYYIKHTKPSKGYKLSKEIIEVEINSQTASVTLIQEVIKRNIEINKLYEFETENKREPNITFEIYDKNMNLYKSITTTETGPDIVTLPYGIYTIKQLNTTYGYEKVNDIDLKVDENSNTSIKYDLLDKKIKSLVHITTMDKKTNENILEKNITYNIKNEETGEYIKYYDESNKEISEFYTNENGELTLPIKLSYGKYILEQISTPKEYLENKEKIKFTINENTEYNYIDNQIMININYYNEEIVGTINIKTLKEIIEISNNMFQKEIVQRENREIELYSEDKIIGTYKTDKKGMLIIDNLKLGNYCLIDKELEEKKCITIINKDNKRKKIEANVLFTQKQHTATVTINNLDEENNPIENTIIELYNNKGTQIKGTTNNEGVIIIENVPINEYCIKEIKISSKYLKNDSPVCFKIDNLTHEKNIEIINKNNFQRISIPNTISNSSVFLIVLLIISGILFKKIA